MQAKDVIITALVRAKEGRGLRAINPNRHLSEAHAKKSDHNLIVMTDLSRLGHEDWVVIAAYYAMYQSALSLLTRIGLESKEHATTVAILEYFFGGQIGRELIEKFNHAKEKHDLHALIMEEKYINYFWKIKRERETVQYGVSIGYKETTAVTDNARKFTGKIRLMNSELDENLVREIRDEIGKLVNAASHKK